MKKVINILLGLCALGLIYITYGSIMGPIRFANERNLREKAVIQRLTDIKNAQTEYVYQHGNMSYCSDFDSLIDFIKNARIPVIKKNGELTDDQLEANWTEPKVLELYEKAQIAEVLSKQYNGARAKRKAIEADTLWQKAYDAGLATLNEDGTRSLLLTRDTIWVELMDSLYKGRLNPDSLNFIPFGNGAKFELTTSSDTSKSGLIQYSFMCRAPYEAFLEGLDKQEIINLLEDCDDRGRFRGLQVDPNSGNWE